jgi:uncharacterized protein (DUF697 family)
MFQDEIIADTNVIAESENEATEEGLSAMDRHADRVIATWTFGSLAANLMPPPLDVIAVSAAFVRMGQRLARVYEVEITPRELRPLVKAMVKGISGVALAAHIGTGLFKYVPGVNIWVALLVQPPIVAAIAYSVGSSFKAYYRILKAERRALSPDELRELTTQALRKRIG